MYRVRVVFKNTNFLPYIIWGHPGAGAVTSKLSAFVASVTRRWMAPPNAFGHTPHSLLATSPFVAATFVGHSLPATRYFFTALLLLATQAVGTRGALELLAERKAELGRIRKAALLGDTGQILVRMGQQMAGPRYAQTPNFGSRG